MFALLALAALAPAADPFVLKTGDRVVWVGSTIVEREQRYGHWETALHAAFPTADFTVRNLGWSGDTVFGDARAGFDTPKEGFQRLVGLALELKPTVVFVSYGTNESFDGKDGLPKFEKGLAKLLDALAPSKARVVLFTPWPFERDAAARGPDDRNAALGLYAQAVRNAADGRGYRTADLNAKALRHRSSGTRFTDNGMHLTDAGYAGTIPDFLDALGLSWPGSDPDRFEPLRKAVLAKNELFFHRWRPQNETYLFGFRKHEQGKNAKEIAEFDPLVAAAEKDIERIKKELLK